MQELIIHLGDHKTGSSSLQTALAGGLVHINGRVPFYPAKRNHNGLAQTLIRRGRRAPGLGQEPGQVALNRLRELSDRFDRSDAAIGILSAEHFEFVDPATLAAALNATMPQYVGRMRLLAYVRPHASRLLSSFATLTKLGHWNGSLDDFLDREIMHERYDYTPRFSCWRATFGDRFTLRPFLRDMLVDGDVVADMASFVADGGSWHVEEQDVQNESPSVPDLVMLREIHSRIPYRRYKKDGAGQNGHDKVAQLLGRSLGQILSALPDNRPVIRLQLHRSLAERVIASYRQDAAALDAAFFADAPLSRALERAVDGTLDMAQSLEATDYFSPAELRQIALWGDIFTRLIAADPAHFAWAVRHPDYRSARDLTDSPGGPGADPEEDDDGQ